MSLAFAPTIRALEALETGLRAQGVSALYLFGSLARREGGADSDIDLAFDIAPGARFSLFDQARIARELSESLGARVDFIPRRMIHPAIRSRVEMEQVKVFG